MRNFNLQQYWYQNLIFCTVVRLSNCLTRSHWINCEMALHFFERPHWELFNSAHQFCGSRSSINLVVKSNKRRPGKLTRSDKWYFFIWAANILLEGNNFVSIIWLFLNAAKKMTLISQWIKTLLDLAKAFCLYCLAFAKWQPKSTCFSMLWNPLY